MPTLPGDLGWRSRPGAAPVRAHGPASCPLPVGIGTPGNGAKSQPQPLLLCLVPAMPSLSPAGGCSGRVGARVEAPGGGGRAAVRGRRHHGGPSKHRATQGHLGEGHRGLFPPPAQFGREVFPTQWKDSQSCQGWVAGKGTDGSAVALPWASQYQGESHCSRRGMQVPGCHHAVRL